VNQRNPLNCYSHFYEHCNFEFVHMNMKELGQNHLRNKTSAFLQVSKSQKPSKMGSNPGFSNMQYVKINHVSTPPPPPTGQ
jgi:hypothetical protein